MGEMLKVTILVKVVTVNPCGERNSKPIVVMTVPSSSFSLSLAVQLQHSKDSGTYPHMNQLEQVTRESNRVVPTLP